MGTWTGPYVTYWQYAKEKRIETIMKDRLRNITNGLPVGLLTDDAKRMQPMVAGTFCQTLFGSTSCVFLHLLRHQLETAVAWHVLIEFHDDVATSSLSPRSGPKAR
eukprot:5902944-Pyramimonas_sp.AAC.1